MSDEQTEQAVTVVDPMTAEVLALRDASVDQLASTLGNVRELERNLKAVKRKLGDELHRRMDEQRHWTLEGQRWRVTSGSSEPVTAYNADQLEEVLRAWVREGGDRDTIRMRHQAYVRAIETVVSKKVKVGGVKAILKGADSGLRNAIESTRFTVEKDRYPRVELR